MFANFFNIWVSIKQEVKKVSPETDMELIIKTLEGDLTAFDLLMQHYQKLVYQISYSFGKNKDNALDISQNVFIKVYQKLSTFKAKSSFKSWLSKITYNEGINWVRANQKHLNHQSIDNPDGLSWSVISHDDESLAKENKSKLIQCLYELNTRYRLAVVLRYFEDMPIKDIASTLQCSEGVVKNMLFRSLRKLKDRLQVTKVME